MSTPLRAAFAALLLTGFSLPAFAEGDVAKGEKVFKKCLACHAIEADAAKKVGPNLHEIVGRKTGSQEGFSYSAKMRALGEEGHIWTTEELEKFLENPKAMVPGTKMAFVGLKKPEERKDIVAYMASLSPNAAGAAEAPADAEAAPEGNSAP